MHKIDILTYATGYHYDVYERFVGSLNKTGFSGNIHIIINENDIEKLNCLKKKYTNVFYFVDKATNVFYFVDNAKKITTHINNHRFFIIFNYLKCNYISSEYIFICDFRDVLFQKNIEEYHFDSNIDLYGFLEGIKINQDTNCNAPWVKKLDIILNEQIYEKISDNYVICCGTTLGKIDAIKSYVEMMCNILSNHNIIENLDQAIHNYMLHLNKLDGVSIKLLSNEDNLVNTVGCDIHKMDDNSNIVNNNNDISYVVHQYDRFSDELKQKLNDKHGLNFFR